MKKRPSGWWYVPSILLCTVIAGMLWLGAVSVSQRWDKLGHGLGQIAVGIVNPFGRNLPVARAEFPGRAAWELKDAGPWHVAMLYATDERPDLGALRCTLRHAQTRESVRLIPCRDDDPKTYNPGALARDAERMHSVEVFLFEIAEPGTYDFEAVYPDGASAPARILAPGRDHNAEPLDRFWTRGRKTLVLALSGFAALLGGVLLTRSIHRKRNAARDAG